MSPETAETMLVRTAAEIDGGWLARVLDRPGLRIGAIEPIGTGQMSESHRVRYAGEDGEQGTVVVKLASADEGSRSTGAGLGAYLREINFYRQLRDRIGGPLARCHLAAYDGGEGWFTLVLEDISDGVQGDQIAGCSPEQAEIALRALARIHAPVWNDLALGAADWLNQPSPLNQGLLTAVLPGFLERYGERIDPAHRRLCERFVDVVDAWDADRRPPAGLVHGDYRLDNLLFREDGSCTVVDWQTVGWGPVMRDASYFVAGGLEPEDRRRHERELIRCYHAELGANGVEGFDWEQCWEEYRRQCFLGLVMTIGAAMLVERTERGDEMFMTWLERNAQMAIDLGAEELLPAPGAGASPPLRPDPADEGRHPAGPEQLWNESWYLDAVSDDGGLGVYHRIGRLPNLDRCLVTTCIVRPGKPAIMLVEAEAPLPAIEDELQAVATETVRAEHRIERRLERLRVVVEGTAEAHADHSAPLRGERGEPVEIGLDLSWETNGVPYSWRLATRYEIPCRVSGTVRIDERSFELEGPGQRDHSWGSRDWWASDWMWSALHLDDGTHTHAVSVPTHPDFGVGYVQKGGELIEVGGVSSTETVTPDGLVGEARIAMTPGGVEVELEPLAFGAILLTAPDGRVSHFPRAMCRVRSSDGRAGFGWVEWNRNQSTNQEEE